MKNKHFDFWELRQISSIAKKNPIEANLRYEEYLKKYKDDYNSYIFYAMNLICLGELDKAEKVLEFVESKINDNSEVFAELGKLKTFEESYFWAKIKLLSYQEKYAELYELLLKSNPEMRQKVSVLNFYCRKKLGLLDINRRDSDSNSYLFKQILEYREDEFVDHVQQNLLEEKYINEETKAIFVSNFPVNRIINEIKKYIPSGKKLFSNYWDNNYIFKYDGCGKVDGKSVDYFEAVCFHNTSNIITIRPISNGQNLPMVDLNYLVQDINSNVKMSQIDKFNKRYNRC